ncbi:LuxR C-terminal-related transcriptional regulator [Ramlibacter sp. MAHUQ-53]|uniref:LuxR C-terminal-related transcriptional regulator n=1 Tax=unclassified Ramlibacter TaxID=2617605 RepID=UPI0036339D54
MSQPGILVVDDHPVYRDALSEKLRTQFEPSGLRVAAAASAGEGLEIVEASPAGVRWTVILDILMPGLSGLAGIRAFKAAQRVEHVVAISGLEEKVWEARTLAAGASLFISKNSTSDAIGRRLTELLRLHALPQEAAPAPERFRLTSRQMEVLALIGRGHPNKIIAGQLQISEQTVKIHVNQIFKELRVFNRTQAVLKAQEHQLI